MRAIIWTAVLFAASAVPSAQAAGDCTGSKAAIVAAMRLSQPLIAVPGGDSDLQVEARRDGCVRVHYPSWDSRAGTYAYRLSNAELAKLRIEIDTTRVKSFVPGEVRADLARRDARKRAQHPAPVGYYVSDEAVLELQFETDAGSATAPLVWTGLRGQLLNHPDQEALVGLAAIRDRLLELGSDQRMTKVQQP